MMPVKPDHWGIAFACIDELRSDSTDRLGIIAIIAASAIVKSAHTLDEARDMVARLETDIEMTVGRMMKD